MQGDYTPQMQAIIDALARADMLSQGDARKTGNIIIACQQLIELAAGQQRQIDDLHRRLAALELTETDADADSGVEDLRDQRRRAAERLADWPRPEEHDAD